MVWKSSTNSTGYGPAATSSEPGNEVSFPREGGEYHQQPSDYPLLKKRLPSWISDFLAKILSPFPAFTIDLQVKPDNLLMSSFLKKKAGDYSDYLLRK
jgi:hypothetical protein